jgi:hypothetical protein
VPGRIITLQRQARELGRLRAGTYVPPANGKRGYPQRSRTWILTSHQRGYLEAAAELFGGTVEPWTPQGSKDSAWRLTTDTDSIDAIMPPGDPLSQHNEMWSRGGCQRRCDGETESLSGNACLCLAEHGEDFHQLDPEQVCRPHTRLNVILPDLPDLGVWRMESKGYYAANEIAAAVDMIRLATGGKVAVPIRLRIEPRKRVSQGKTKQFPVIVVEIRGATAGQILAGSAPTIALEAAAQRTAIEAASTAPKPAAIEAPVTPGITADEVRRQAASAEDLQTVQRLWQEAAQTRVLDDALAADLKARAKALNGTQAPAGRCTNGTAGDQLPEPDADEVWNQIVAAAAKQGISKLEDLEQMYRDRMNHDPIDATGRQLARFLDEFKAGQVMRR